MAARAPSPALSLAIALSWGLPNLLVSAVGLALAARGARWRLFEGAVVLETPFMRRLGGVCLGPVILVHPGCGEELLRHEWGHFQQHLRLGPLYHLVIGLPSLGHAIWFQRWGPRQQPHRYFHFYTEAWADDLGGVYALHHHLHPKWWGYLGLG